MSDNSKPAFPRSGPGGDEGMSLREYFAAQAMQAHIIADAICGSAMRHRGGLYSDLNLDDISKNAWEQADAMIAQGEKS